jgi:hypothetical protein
LLTDKINDESDIDMSKALSRRGRIYAYLGQYDEALRDYNQELKQGSLFIDR